MNPLDRLGHVAGWAVQHAPLEALPALLALLVHLLVAIAQPLAAAVDHEGLVAADEYGLPHEDRLVLRGVLVQLDRTGQAQAGAAPLVHLDSQINGSIGQWNLMSFIALHWYRVLVH